MTEAGLITKPYAIGIRREAMEYAERCVFDDLHARRAIDAERILEYEISDAEFGRQKIGQRVTPCGADRQILARKKPFAVPLHHEQFAGRIDDCRRLKHLEVVLADAHFSAQPIYAFP